jgi:hypothetical protein
MPGPTEFQCDRVERPENQCKCDAGDESYCELSWATMKLSERPHANHASHARCSLNDCVFPGSLISSVTYVTESAISIHKTNETDSNGTAH